MNTIQRNKVSDYLEQYKQEYLKQNRKTLGIFYTPDNICELIDVIARIYNPQTVIDICCGTGNLLSYFNDLQTVKGIDCNPDVISLAQKINPDIDFLLGDTLEHDFENETYDLVLGSLPFGGIRFSNRKSLEELLIRKGLEILSQNGVAIFIVSPGITSDSKYSDFRTYLLENFAIDMIISLPNKTFFYTGIQTYIFVIRNGKPNKEIFMPIFDGEISTIANDFKQHQGNLYLEITEINDRLDRRFYLSLKSIEENFVNYPAIKLSEISTIIEGETFQKNDFKSSGKYLVFNRKDKEGNNFVDSIRNLQCILRENDIVIGLIGNNSIIEIYQSNYCEVVVPKNYAIVRQLGDIDKHLYLRTYLQTEQGKLFFEKVKEAAMQGSAIPHLSIKSLSDITVPVIPLEELNKLISQDAKKSIEIKDEIKTYFELIEQRNYEEATFLVEQGFKNYDKEEKKVYYSSIEKTKNLDKTTEVLKEKDKELEDMMSMFAHKFRSPLDAIVYNTNHENNPKVYIEAAQTMRGLLDIFSIISTDDELLERKLKDDIQGKGRLINIVNSTLKMALLHLLSVSAVDKIRQHYMFYAIQHGKVDNQITPKIWYNDYDELESSLQLEWEKSFSDLINYPFNLDDQLKWIEQHFFRLKIIGFDRDDIQFKEYGVTESFLVILLNEIIINAFKYYSSDRKEAVVLKWADNGDHQTIECHNPSTLSERTRSKGSGKGHTFLSALARKTNSRFIKPEYQDSFVINFSISSQLLKARI